jgi:hypothetical protein
LKKIWVLVMFVFVSGCATGYHSATHPILGISGGFIDNEGPGDLIEVAFYGNGFTKNEQAGLFLMYRCAELVMERNKNHFVMYRSVTHAIADMPEPSGYLSSIAGQPVAKVYILVEETRSLNSFSASNIIEKYTNEVKGKKHD